MFATEPILWLQSMRSDMLTVLMQGISMLVNDTVFLILGLVLFFSADHRKSFVVLVVLVWAGLATAVLKSWCALPRPGDVDVRVLLLDSGEPNRTPLVAQGATTFLGLPSDAAIEYARALPARDFGLPSGHCSSTVAFWGTIALLFRKKWTTAVALILTVVMPLSRMYLGRHFPGDTVAGLLLGAIVLLCVISLMRTVDVRPVDSATESAPLRPVLAHLTMLIVLPMILILFDVTRVYATVLLALGLVFYGTRGLQLYDANATLLSRILTTGGSLGIMAGLLALLKTLVPKSIAYGLVIVAVFGLTAVALAALKPRSRLKQNA